MKQEIIYKWVKYRLMWSGKYYLSQSTHNSERANAKSLHRVIWEDNYWPIPDWYDIHHKDWNTFNNDISNLELIEHSKHLSEHMKTKWTDDWYKDKWLKNLNKWRKYLTDKKGWKNVRWYEKKCLCCWYMFVAQRIDTKYCCKRCWENHTRRLKRIK